MSFTVEQWAKDWLAEQRDKGEKCYEVKVSNGRHYVYHSTTRYDRTTKKPRKVSEYLGTLDREKGFIPRRKKKVESETYRTVKISGPLRLLDSLGGDIATALEHRFGDLWQRIYATALLMSISPVRMRNASSCWDKYEGVRGLEPAMSEASMKQMYVDVGDDLDAQNLFFHDMSQEVDEIVFDLSGFFSMCGELSLAEAGGDLEYDYRRQVNIVMSCDMDTGEPLYSRVLYGDVCDAKALTESVKVIRHKTAVIVADCRSHSESNLNLLMSSGMHFAIPVGRDSDYYEQVSVSVTNAFKWKDKVIRYGRRQLPDGIWLYRFENLDMACGEERNAMEKVMDGRMTEERFLEERKRMGHMVVLSDLDRDPEWIYTLYKRRDSVENGFRRYFEVLGADSFGASDDLTVSGMVFVVTLALRLRARLESLISQRGLASEYSTDDVLEEYSKAYAVESASGTTNYEVPAKLDRLDSDLGFNTFSVLRN